MPTQSTVGAPYLVELHGTSVAHQVTDPLGCILAGGGHHGLVTPPHPFIISYYGNGENVHGVTDPVYTVTGTDRHALVSPFLVSVNYFDDIVRPVSEPIPTQTTAPKLGIAITEAQPPRVEDCYFRMLKSHEIGRAMAFPDTYVVLGNERERVKQYGNAVTPPVMTWIFNRCLEALSN
jgi:DNA (cytosine-5)-methyltransferase 1